MAMLVLSRVFGLQNGKMFDVVEMEPLSLSLIVVISHIEMIQDDVSILLLKS